MSRFGRIAARLDDYGLDAMMITSEPNRLYAAGFHSTAGMAIVTRAGSYFFTDSRYAALDAQVVEDICYGIAIHVDDQADFAGCRTPFAETVGDADNIDRFDAFRIYDNLRFKGFYELPLSERLDWLTSLLLRLEQLEKMELATPAAAALWRDKVAFQKMFFQRLLEQMKAGCLPDETEEL